MKAFDMVLPKDQVSLKDMEMSRQVSIGVKKLCHILCLNRKGRLQQGNQQYSSRFGMDILLFYY